MMRWLCATVLVLCAGSAHAGAWQKCDLTVRVLDEKWGQLHAEVLAVKAKPQVICPAVADFIAFTPETADYQSVLPRRYWPTIGQKWRVRYQYLDGFCYSGKACTIKHYPVLK
ncbi:MAG: hypothetical protein ACRCV6_10845 [Formosimonas sp.]